MLDLRIARIMPIADNSKNFDDACMYVNTVPQRDGQINRLVMLKNFFLKIRYGLCKIEFFWIIVMVQ